MPPAMWCFLIETWFNLIFFFLPTSGCPLFKKELLMGLQT